MLVQFPEPYVSTVGRVFEHVEKVPMTLVLREWNRICMAWTKKHGKLTCNWNSNESGWHWPQTKESHL